MHIIIPYEKENKEIAILHLHFQVRYSITHQSRGFFLPGKKYITYQFTNRLSKFAITEVQEMEIHRNCDYLRQETEILSNYKVEKKISLKMPSAH